MLEIRLEQMEALDEVSGSPLTERLIEHVKEVFPVHCEQLGEPHLARVVAEAQSDARTLRLATDYAVFEYVNLVFVFGTGFHRQPEHEWFLDILDDPTTDDVMVKLQRIRNRTVEILQQRARPE